MCVGVGSGGVCVGVGSGGVCVGVGSGGVKGDLNIKVLC